MSSKVQRRTVDLSAFPDLVVIYLGMRVNALTGLKTLVGFGPKIAQSVSSHPDGLLLHENFLFSLFPPHGGVRRHDSRHRLPLLCAGAGSAGKPVFGARPGAAPWTGNPAATCRRA